MAKSKISLGKCHIAFEDMWIISKYLLYWSLNIIPQWEENRRYMITTPLHHKIFTPCFMSLDMPQCLLIYCLRELKQNVYSTNPLLL